MRLLSVLICVSFFLVGCTCSECEVPNSEALSVTLSPERVSPREEVTATLSRAVADLRVTLAGSEIPTEKQNDSTYIFELPEAAPSGLQEVIVEGKGSLGRSTLDVLGKDIIEGEVVIAFPEDDGQELESLLEKSEFSLIEIVDLPGDIGPCSGSLARVDVGDILLGEAIERLKTLEESGEAVEYLIDPPTKYSGGANNVIENSSLLQTLQANQSLGQGTTIAVIDTGVDNPTGAFTNPPLQGYNAIDGSNNTLDDTPEKHGTTVARIAAGDVGIAQGANILPVKVCDAQGKCIGSDIIEGVCWALKNAPTDTALSLNFSLGGDTRMEILEVLLDAAIKENVFVSASAGNDGEFGPIHYPAAHDLDGLIAVGTVEQCVSFDGLPDEGRYAVGERFESGFAKVKVKPFFFLPDGSTSQGFATVSTVDTGLLNKELFVSNVNLEFELSSNLTGLNLDFADQGGNINLSINDSFVNVGDLSELDGEVVGGVVISVEEGDGVGILRLSSEVNRFAIGGQELSIDNLCIGAEDIETSSNNWLPATFSTWGKYVDIAAPIPPELILTGELKTLGTSFSAPVIAGVAAAVRSQNLSLSPARIQQCLEKAAIDLSPIPSTAVGAGLLDATGQLPVCR